MPSLAQPRLWSSQRLVVASSHPVCNLEDWPSERGWPPLPPSWPPPEWCQKALPRVIGSGMQRCVHISVFGRRCSRKPEQSKDQINQRLGIWLNLKPPPPPGRQHLLGCLDSTGGGGRNIRNDLVTRPRKWPEKSHFGKVFFFTSSAPPPKEHFSQSQPVAMGWLLNGTPPVRLRSCPLGW